MPTPFLEDSIDTIKSMANMIRGFMPNQKGVSRKVNVIIRLEFQLETAVQYFDPYATESHPTKKDFLW